MREAGARSTSPYRKSRNSVCSIPRIRAAALICGRLSRHAVVNAYRLGDLIRHGVDRVQARHRILEDDADPAAPQAAHLLGRQLQEVLVFEEDLA